MIKIHEIILREYFKRYFKLSEVRLLHQKSGVNFTPSDEANKISIYSLTLKYYN